MKKTKIAINGFGRIGRLALRIISKRDDAEVVAINDPFLTVDYAKYLLEHDSIHGHFDEKVSIKGDKLIVGNIKFLSMQKKSQRLFRGKMTMLRLL